MLQISQKNISLLKTTLFWGDLIYVCVCIWSMCANATESMDPQNWVRGRCELANMDAET